VKGREGEKVETVCVDGAIGMRRGVRETDRLGCQDKCCGKTGEGLAICT